MKYASLVVLSYQRPEFTRRSIHSLVNSTGGKTPYEIIVVDDGSRDANWPALMQMVRNREISSLVLNAGDNLGVGVGINRGFQLGRGEWLVKLDADLEYKPGWIDAGAFLLDNFPEVGVVGFFDYHTYSAADPRFNKTKELTWNGRVVGYEVDDFVGSAFMIRRDDYLQYGVDGGFWCGLEEGSDAFAEDVMWKKMMVELGYSLAVTATDMITNFGFGLGNSTVVVEENGQPVVAKIHKLPLIFNTRQK